MNNDDFIPMIKLNNGICIPQMGFGASMISGYRQLLSKKTLRIYGLYKYAMERYNLFFDSSAAYGFHENVIGRAMRYSSNKENIFLCTKLSNTAQRTGKIAEALDKSLQNLGRDFVDLYLMHWPQTDTYIASYLQMEKLYKEGKARAIGVCNFHEHHLKKLAEAATVLPAVNQMEIHPLFTQEKLVRFCKDKGIQVMAYSPLGRMHDVLMKSKILRELAEKYMVTVPQVILRWDIQKGFITLPRTSDKTHFMEFMEILKFELTEEEVGKISALNENIRLRFNPDSCDFSIL